LITTKITVCQTANNTSTTAQHNDHLYQARLLRSRDDR